MKKGFLVVGIVVLCLIGLGFFQYQQLESGSIKGESLSALSTAFSATLSDTDADLEQVNQLLGVLDHVSNLAKLDTGLFAMPSYVLLRDFSVTLYPAQSVGRTNPFLGIDEIITADPTAPKAPTQKSSPIDTTTDQVSVDAPVGAASEQAADTANAQASQQPATDTSGQSQAPSTPSGAGSAPPQCDPLVDPSCFDFSAANSLFGGGQ